MTFTMSADHPALINGNVNHVNGSSLIFTPMFTNI